MYTTRNSRPDDKSVNSNNGPLAVSDTNDLCSLMRHHIARGHVHPLMNIHACMHHCWIIGVCGVRVLYASGCRLRERKSGRRVWSQRDGGISCSPGLDSASHAFPSNHRSLLLLRSHSINLLYPFQNKRPKNKHSYSISIVLTLSQIKICFK
jgi:hypothetical protein